MRFLHSMFICCLLAPCTALAQQPCPSGSPLRGHLGFTIGCDCTVSTAPEERPWQFRSPIRVAAVEAGGSAAGKLRAGDIIVAVDGIDVTTPDGARRLAGLEPGQRVSLTIQREGQDQRVDLVASAICPQDARALGAYAPAPLAAPRFHARATAPAAPQRNTTPDIRAVPVPTLPDLRPAGRLGLALACANCGWEREDGDAQPRWRSATPPHIYAVETAGPAAAAGIRPGDVLLQVNGQEITTRAAGVALGAAAPGVPLRLRLQRSGQALDTSLTPGAWDGAPPDLQNRYNGSFGGVQVDVQSSDPAAVTVNAAGTEMIILVNGAMVRLRVR